MYARYCTPYIDCRLSFHEGLDRLVHGEKSYPGVQGKPLTCQVESSVTAHLILNLSGPNHHRTDDAKAVPLAAPLSEERMRRKIKMAIQVSRQDSHDDELVENEVKFTEAVAFDGMEESAV